MGFGFCGTNQTNKKVCREQIHIGGHKLCNQMGGGQIVEDKHCSNNIKILK